MPYITLLEATWRMVRFHNADFMPILALVHNADWQCPITSSKLCQSNVCREISKCYMRVDPIPRQPPIVYSAHNKWTSNERICWRNDLGVTATFLPCQNCG